MVVAVVVVVVVVVVVMTKEERVGGLQGWMIRAPRDELLGIGIMRSSSNSSRKTPAGKAIKIGTGWNGWVEVKLASG